MQVPLVTAVLLLLGGAGVLGLSRLIGWLLRRRYGARLRAVARGCVVLTYDDGPGHAVEPRLLEVLARHQARATFFLLGRTAEKAPDRCATLKSAGHEIACHGYAHVNAWRVPPWRALADIKRGYDVLAPWLSVDRLFRPPNGKLTFWTWLALRRRGVGIAYWTHDSGDTCRGTTPPSVEALVAAVEASEGGVVLLHSFDRDPPDAMEDFVVHATEALLTAARARDWRVCTQSELTASAGRS